MPVFVPVASIGEIPAGSAKTVIVGDREIALFNIGGAYYATESTCPHQGGPLAEGSIEGSIVTCPWHAWCFDVRTGKMTLGEFAYVEVFDVEVRDSAILVSLEPRP